MSGVALSGGAWQALSANDEVELEAGDMVTLLLDQNEQETTAEGVFIYAVDRIEDSSAKSWFSW